MMRPRGRGWIAAAAVLLACTGCGFKGPLYLPERNATVVTHPAQAARGAQSPAPQQPAAKGKVRKSPAPPQSTPPPQSPPPQSPQPQASPPGSSA
jgi:predicted small lipoprotein YifL